MIENRLKKVKLKNMAETKGKREMSDKNGNDGRRHMGNRGEPGGRDSRYGSVGHEKRHFSEEDREKKSGKVVGERKSWKEDGEKSGKVVWEKKGEKAAGGKKGQKAIGEKNGQKAIGKKNGQKVVGERKNWKEDGERRNWKAAGEKNQKAVGEKKGWKEVGEKNIAGEKKSQKAVREKSWTADGEKRQKVSGKGIKYQEKNSWQSDRKDNVRGQAGQETGQKNGLEKDNLKRSGQRKSQCPVFSRCGGCQFIDMPYKKQLEIKQKQLDELLKPYCRVNPIIGMEDPYHYRNKVHAVFDHDRKGNPVSGVYEANTHRVVPVESCFIEDHKADEIIGTIRGMLKSFKIRTYDEDTGYGLLRHVLIRRGFATGEIMVVLVTADPVFPSKSNFVKALREKHPEITTVIQNINGKNTNMVLGDKEHVLFGKGYIEDVLCGCRFRISSKSFYQINPVQTEILYQKAIGMAGLTGKEKVIDAYCGIGTIGIVASKRAGQVIGVELNRDAVRDAMENAKLNGIKNVQFYCNDAGAFMVNMAEQGEKADVVFMDPPRSGSTEDFINSVAKMKPEKVVYVSCGPETLARDLGMFEKRGYRVKEAWGIDLFPQTLHVECVVLMSRKDK